MENWSENWQNMGSCSYVIVDNKLLVMRYMKLILENIYRTDELRRKKGNRKRKIEERYGTY